MRGDSGRLAHSDWPHSEHPAPGMTPTPYSRHSNSFFKLVGRTGFEPVTFSVSGKTIGIMSWAGESLSRNYQQFCRWVTSDQGNPRQPRSAADLTTRDLRVCVRQRTSLRAGLGRARGDGAGYRRAWCGRPYRAR